MHVEVAKHALAARQALRHDVLHQRRDEGAGRRRCAPPASRSSTRSASTPASTTCRRCASSTASRVAAARSRRSARTAARCRRRRPTRTRGATSSRGAPRGVILAGRNSARYSRTGEEKTLPGERLFSRHWLVDVKGFGEFEAYFNRDSIPYIDTYGLAGVHDMFRATLRYPGWSYTMQKLADLGYFGLDDLEHPPATYAGLTAALARVPEGADLAGRRGRSPRGRPGVRHGRRAWSGSASSPRADPLGRPPDARRRWTRSPRGCCRRCRWRRASATSASCSTRSSGSTRRATRETDHVDAGRLRRAGRRLGHRAHRRAAGGDRRDDGPRRAHRRPGRADPVSPSVYTPILDELAASAGVVFNERTSVVLPGEGREGRRGRAAAPSRSQVVQSPAAARRPAAAAGRRKRPGAAEAGWGVAKW